MASVIEKYFPTLSSCQKERFDAILRLYPEWNEKINVISRKDIDNLETNHILHSLAIARYIKFADSSRVMDLGCGGGFPGIPLAIMFPEVRFHLIDRTGKKIRVAREIAEATGLDNITFQHGDAAECKEKFDFVVSRAVMSYPDLVKIARPLIGKTQHNALPNGLIALKGGDLNAELRSVREISEITDVNQYFTEAFFDNKKIIYTPI